MRELKADNPAAGLYNTHHFFECLFQMRNVSYSEADGCAVKGIVIKTYLLCVALHITDVFQKAPVNTFIPAVFQHFHIYIVNNNSAVFADSLCHEHGDISSSSAYIYCRVAWFEACFFRHKPLPEPVRAKAHEVIHQIVFIGNRGEYLLHPVFLFRRRDYLVAEMCCIFLLHYFLSLFKTDEPILNPRIPAIANPIQLNAGSPQKAGPFLYVIARNDEPIISAAIIIPMANLWPRIFISSDNVSSL